LKLPSLDSLIQNAIGVPMGQVYNARIDYEKSGLKTEKRRWLDYFGVFASYQYGIGGLNQSTTSGLENPLIYQYLSTNQVYYNVGASFSMQFGSLSDFGNKVRRQRIKITEAERLKDAWYDEQKEKIIKLYFEIQSMLNELGYTIELRDVAEAQYVSCKKDFAVGKSTAWELYISKAAQSQENQKVETAIGELKISLMRLELLTNTKILNK